MALDSDLLSQAKAAEERVIEAEHAAEVARADFHRAVRRLHLAGGSLREVADALGLSHQRIHQIVEDAGGSRRWRSRRRSGDAGLLRCSMCGRDQKHVKRLIAGPGVYTCDICVANADRLLKGGTEAAGYMVRIAADNAAERCSFCGKRRDQVQHMACAANARICGECLGLCQEIITEELA